MDLQVGGTSQFKVTKSGHIYLGSSNFGIYLVPTTGGLVTVYRRDTGVGYAALGNSSRAGVGVQLGGGFFFSNGTDPDAALTSGLAGWGITSDGDNIISIKRYTTAQEFRVYNTYTSTSNRENFKVDWKTSANICCIGTSKGSGGGTARDLQVDHGDSQIFTVRDTGIDVVSGCAYYHNGIQVVGAQQAGVPTHNTSHSMAGGDTVDRTALEAALNDIGSRLNDFRGILNTHGLTTTV